MIRKETVTAIVGTEALTPKQISLTLGIGRGYNTCSIDGKNLSGNVGEQLNVSINGDEYSFIITDKNYSQSDNVTLEAKGIPFVLDNQSKSEDILDYQDSDSLIEGERGLVEVQNDIPNIVFGNQTYNKSNTPMGRITDMVNVVGGEMYEIDSVLYLQEIATIAETPTIAHTFSDSEIFSYAYSDTIGQSVVLNQVLINPITDDLYAEPSVTVEYDEDTELAHCYFNPSLSTGYAYSFAGIVPRTPTVVSKTESFLLSDETYIRTVAGIDAIAYVTLDGEPFTDYVSYFPYNLIRFSEQISGTIEIKYRTTNIMAFVNTTTDFIIKYQCVKCEGTIEIDSTNKTSSQNCKAEISDSITFESGGYVECFANNDIKLVFVDKSGATNVQTISQGTHAGGGSLTVAYAYYSSPWSVTGWMSNITSSVTTSIDTASGTVEYADDLDAYVVYLDFIPNSVISVREGNVGLTGFTLVTNYDVPYISFNASDEGRKVDISMYVDVVRISIPAPTTACPVTIIDVVACDGVASSEFTNDEDKPCTVPSYMDIDVAGTFNVPIILAYGKTVKGELGTHTVDEFGKIRVYVPSASIYTIDCGNVYAGGVITIDASEVAG